MNLIFQLVNFVIQNFYTILVGNFIVLQFDLILLLKCLFLESNFLIGLKFRL